MLYSPPLSKTQAHPSNVVRRRLNLISFARIGMIKHPIPAVNFQQFSVSIQTIVMQRAADRPANLIPAVSAPRQNDSQRLPTHHILRNRQRCLVADSVVSNVHHIILSTMAKRHRDIHCNAVKCSWYSRRRQDRLPKLKNCCILCKSLFHTLAPHRHS